MGRFVEVALFSRSATPTVGPAGYAHAIRS